MSNLFNLPRQAAFKITSIDGKRCTAVPRNVQSPKATTTPAPAKETKQSTVDKTTDQVEDDNSALPTSTPKPRPAASVTDAVDNESESVPKATRSFATIPTAEAISDTTGTDSSQSRPDPTSTPSGIDDEIDNLSPAESSTRLSGSTASPTDRNSKETNNSTLAPGSDGKSNTGPIVGGVLGTLVLLAIIGIILFFCRRRRRKRNSEPLLSPPQSATREKFYEIDSGSLGPTKRSTRWKREISSRAENAAWDLKTTVAGFGTSIKATVSGDRSDTPSVNLDRGNSQFFRGSFNSHNRNNSSVHSASSGRSSLRERLAEWRKRFGEVWSHQKQGNGTKGPMSNVGSMPDSRVTSLRYRDYRDSDQSGSTATKDLGLSLMDSQTSDLLKLENQPHDPFADPYADPFCDPKHGSVRTSKTPDRPISNPFAAGDSNPFSDPVITNPASTVPKPQTYIQHVRRSRGSMSSSTPSSNRSSRSTDLISFIDRPASITSAPRIPSAIAPSHTNDRDTIYSSFSTERRGKGRSDPFDLERPELWILPSQQRESTLASPTSSAITNASRIKSMIDQNKARGHHRYNSSIRYSSGVDSLEEWGDHGDYVEESVNSSLRGNASSRGGNENYGGNDVRSAGVNKIFGNQAINGSLTEIKVTLNENFSEAKRELERRRNVDNVSPVSAMSVEVGGKATA